MKKFVPSFVGPARKFLAKSMRIKVYGFIAIVFLAGCMATQNRWQATQMRQQVMDYYNDQIMENLIRTKERLPFVHVDITNLTAQDVAGLSGIFGGGDTTGFTRTSPSSSLVGALHTISRTVSRPFSYSVTPTRNTTLSIQAAPVLGKLGDSTPTPTPTPSPTGPALMLSPRPDSTFTSFTVTFRWSSGSATAYKLLVGGSPGAEDIHNSGEINVLSATVNNIPIDGRTIYVTLSSKVDGSWALPKSYEYTAASFQPSKITKTAPENDKAGTATETELTPTAKAAPTPKPLTVYDLYDDFVKKYDADCKKVEAKNKAFCHTEGLNSPPDKYIPGTKKRWGNRYYYIKDEREFREAYRDLCRNLFTKGQAQSIEATIEKKAQAAALVAPR